jgi:hypothetical protein
MSFASLSDAKSVCTARRLGEVIGRTERQVHALTTEKVLRKGARGYRLDENVQAFLAYREQVIRKECSRTSDAYEKARSRRMVVEAVCAELRAGELRAELLRSDDVDREVTRTLSIVRSHLMAIPSRVAYSLLPHVPQEDAEFQTVYNKINVEVRRGLTEASQLEEHGLSKRKDRAKRNGDDA